MKSTWLLFGLAACLPLGLPAADLNVTAGNLNVDYGATIGVAATRGNLTVNGKTGSASGLNLLVSGDGGFYFPASTNTTLAPAITSGNGLFWYAARGALRVGNFSGLSTTAVGQNSIAFGGSASGAGSFAIGGNATGAGSFALGGGQASGIGSVVLGGGNKIASGVQSIALTGYYNNSMGYASAVGGYSTGASGEYSFAYGSGNSTAASAPNSAAFGESNAAIGKSSAVFGRGNTAQAGYSMIVGQYNTLEGDPAGLGAADPLFVVGNGTGTSQRANALVVYKNGNVKIPKRQGDIVMGEFGNGNGD